MGWSRECLIYLIYQRCIYIYHDLRAGPKTSDLSDLSWFIGAGGTDSQKKQVKQIQPMTITDLSGLSRIISIHHDLWAAREISDLSDLSANIRAYSIYHDSGAGPRNI